MAPCCSPRHGTSRCFSHVSFRTHEVGLIVHLHVAFSPFLTGFRFLIVDFWGSLYILDTGFLTAVPTLSGTRDRGFRDTLTSDGGRRG